MASQHARWIFKVQSRSGPKSRKAGARNGVALLWLRIFCSSHQTPQPHAHATLARMQCARISQEEAAEYHSGGCSRWCSEGCLYLIRDALKTDLKVCWRMCRAFSIQMQSVVGPTGPKAGARSSALSWSAEAPLIASDGASMSLSLSVYRLHRSRVWAIS